MSEEKNNKIVQSELKIGWKFSTSVNVQMDQEEPSLGLVASSPAHIAWNMILHQTRSISAQVNYEVLGQMEKEEVAMQPSLGQVAESPSVLAMRCCTRPGPWAPRPPLQCSGRGKAWNASFLNTMKSVQSCISFHPTTAHLSQPI